MISTTALDGPDIVFQTSAAAFSILRLGGKYLPLTWRSRLQSYQICSARNVSQLPTAPDFNPVINHRTRCAEVPWVNASGTT